MLDYKHRHMVDEKKAIGQAAANLVSPGDTVILNSGSTTWHIVEYLGSKEPLTVVSNDLQILACLADFPGITVIDPGGIIRPDLKILLGSNTLNTLQSLHVNWVFLGANAIDPKHGITNPIMEEASIKQAMIRAGQNVVIVADHTKFGRALFTHVCDIRDINMIITDVGIPQQIANEIRSMGVTLSIVG